ncbi:2OG-Fe(II) oxygenase [bacterium]|nr:2OG-Fe(II) oxygenase [bacterium]
MSMWFLKSDTVENWCWNGAFSPEECKKIIEIGDKLKMEKAVIDKNILNEKVRNSDICFLTATEETKWIFERCCYVVNLVNDKFFNYDLTAIKEIQYTVYEEGGFYDKHVDTMYESFGTRKLSFSVQLTDPKEYEGGDLLLHYSNTPVVAKKDQGVMTAFHSQTLHEVQPVTKGRRIALVGWVIGPRFK